MNTLLAVLLVIPALVYSETCDGRNDGIYEISCRAYLHCDGGKPTIVECPRNNTYYTVFNSKTNACDEPRNVDPPCGQEKPCSPHENGRHADTDNHCHSFYTCVDGKFDGHNFCPAGLVFDESLETCNYADQTAPPCGTKH